MRKITNYAFLLLGAFLLMVSCRKFDRVKQLKNFAQVNLVDNNGEYNATITDPTLINAWGIAFNPTGIAWVNSQAGHVSEVYDREGNMLRPPVNIPSPGGATGGNPTGIIFNGGAGFVLSNNEPARFVFVGVDGILSGWNPTAGNNALLIKNNSSTSAYTGLTIAKFQGEDHLYAADFRAGKIQVWDKNFNNVALTFNDPNIPAGYAPFNIQSIDDWLYVLYAKVGPGGEEAAGAGLGYVSIFTTGGDFVKRFASQGALNAPWGIAKAPASFFEDVDDEDNYGKKIGDDKKEIILVGNFGDGYINAFTAQGHFIGPLRSNHQAIRIEGLWAITFPPATSGIDPNRLYFAAGPDDEKDGLFGYIIKK